MNRILKSKIIENYGSQANFAAALDIDETFISKIVNRRRYLSPDQRKVWAAALRCEPQDIFGEE